MRLPPSRSHPAGRDTAGFSLVEMMVVLAIMGIIVSLANVSYKTMLLKAYQAEVKTNIRAINIYVQSFITSDVEMDDPCPLMPAGYTGGIYCQHFNPEYNVILLEKDGVCTPNFLGFMLDNCSKARYGYAARISIGVGANRARSEIAGWGQIEGKTAVGTWAWAFAGGDAWWMTFCGQLHNTVTFDPDMMTFNADFSAYLADYNACLIP